MTFVLKIKGAEYPVNLVCFREKDIIFDHRSTVTFSTDLSYEEIVRLFSVPGPWSVTRKHEPFTDAEGNVIHQPADVVTDCIDYEKLLCIKDTRTGVLEVVMSKITAEEALAELREVLNG